MDIKQVAKRILPPIVSDTIMSIRRAIAYRRYMSGEGIPYSTRYHIYRKKTNYGFVEK